jgi:Na+-driven multidrug efflux pump
MLLGMGIFSSLLYITLLSSSVYFSWYTSLIILPALLALITGGVLLCIMLFPLVRIWQSDGCPPVTLSWKSMRYIGRIFPSASLEPVFLLSSFSVLLMIIAHMGTQEIAIASFAFSVARCVILPCKVFGITTGKFFSESVAHNTPLTAHAFLSSGIRLAYLVVIPLSFLMFFFSYDLLEFFAKQAEPTVFHGWVLKVFALSVLLEPFAGLLSSALKAHGLSQIIFYITLYQWVVVLPLTWFLGVYLKWGILVVPCLLLSFRAVMAWGCIRVRNQLKKGDALISVYKLRNRHKFWGVQPLCFPLMRCFILRLS